MVFTPAPMPRYLIVTFLFGTGQFTKYDRCDILRVPPVRFVLLIRLNGVFLGIFHRQRRGGGLRHDHVSPGFIHRHRPALCGAVTGIADQQHKQDRCEHIEPGGSHTFHKRADDQRAKHRPQPVDKHKPPRGRGHIVVLQKVVGVGDEQRIKRVRHPPHDKRRGQQQGKVRAKEHADERPQDADARDDDDQEPPVHPVGNPPDWILQQHRPHKERCHKSGDLPDAQPRLRAINRCHAKLCRKHAPQDQHPKASQRRKAGELAQRHRFRGVKGRCWADRQQDGRDRNRDKHRRDHKEDKARRVRRQQQRLACHDPKRLHDHIERQRLAPVGIVRRLVQPAFRRDVDCRKTKADQDTPRRPDPRVCKGRVEDHHRRDQRGQCRKNPHMPHAPDHPRCHPAAAEEPGKIGGHDDGHLKGREPFDLAPDTQKRALHPVAHHQQAHSQKQRPRACQNLNHILRLLPGVPVALATTRRRGSQAVATCLCRFCGFLRGQQKRCVPVREKAIFPRHRMGIDAPHALLAHQRRYQHHQRRFGQVEIRHQPIAHLKCEAGIDKDIGVAFPGADAAVARHRLDQPQRRGAHRDHAPAACFGIGDVAGGLCAHLPPFGMHLVGGHILHLDRQERARPHMQGDMGKAHTTCGQRRQQRVIEMQRCGRGGNSTAVLGPNRLIIRLVLRIGGPFRRNIGRQWHRPRLGQCRIKVIATQIEFQVPLTIRDALQGRAERIRKHNNFADLQLFQRLDQRRPTAIRTRFQQGGLDPGARRPLATVAGPVAKQPRRDHPRVIQHQQIAGAQPVRQIRHDLVMKRVPICHQQACRRAGARRSRCDQALGQVKIKVTQFHGAGLSPAISVHQPVADALRAFAARSGLDQRRAQRLRARQTARPPPPHLAVSVQARGIFLEKGSASGQTMD
mmetsp:Transcript_18096/g.27983  ORF Transcript_18096/g.27983 Transcript_18096/m.27983 type:complete len:908 (-) Transcript_18096:1716-4439(-)